MTRNKKALLVWLALSSIALLALILVALVPKETRVKGTIDSHKVELPLWASENVGMKISTVSRSWIWLGIVIAGGSMLLAGCSWAIGGERLGEVQKERSAWEIEQEKDKRIKAACASQEVALVVAKLQREGEAALALHEQELIIRATSIAEANGLVLPSTSDWRERERAMVGDAVRTDPLLQEAVDRAVSEKLAVLGYKPPIEPIVEPPDEFAKHTQMALKLLDGLGGVDRSILSAAPTGAGKTHQLLKWMRSLYDRTPNAQVLIIGQKYDSFLGHREANRLILFDPSDLKPVTETIDAVYKELLRRRKLDESERKQCKFYPIRLVLDDWYSIYEILSNRKKLWESIAEKLAFIITVGREFNVCLYFGTQSANLEALGITPDSSIRSNLYITSLGFVSEKEGVEQGDYAVLELIIRNQFIVPNKQHRDTLLEEFSALMVESQRRCVPIVFRANGTPELGLMPSIDRDALELEGIKSIKPWSGKFDTSLDTPEKVSSEVSESISTATPDISGNTADEVGSYQEYQSDSAREEEGENPPDRGGKFLPDTPDTLDTPSPQEWPRWLPIPSRLVNIAYASQQSTIGQLLKIDLGITNGERRKVAIPIIEAVVRDWCRDMGDTDLLDKFKLD